MASAKEEEPKPIICNNLFEVYELRKKKSSSGPNGVYFFSLKTLADSKRDDMRLLQESIRVLLSKKASVCLDCSKLEGTSMMKAHVSLSFDSFRTLQGGAQKFALVTTSGAVRSVANIIISMKRASAYATVVSTVDEALAFVSRARS